MIHADGARFEIDWGGGKASEREAWARGGVYAGAARPEEPRGPREEAGEIRLRWGSREFWGRVLK
jgi:hypothetical protein